MSAQELRFATDESLACPPGTALYVTARTGHFTDLVLRRLRRVGGEAVAVRQAAEAHRLLDAGPPRALVLEGDVPGVPRLVWRVKTCAALNPTPILLFCEAPPGPPGPAGVRVEPDLLWVEPFEVEPALAALAELLWATAAALPGTVRLRLACGGAEAGRRRALVLAARLLRSADVPLSLRHRILPALEESLRNGWRHGHRRDATLPLSVDLFLDPRRVHLTVTDRGPGHPARERLAAAPLGSGLHRLARLADRLEFNRRGNAILFSWDLP